MKTIRISLCIILCLLTLTSCANNSDYFKQALAECPEETQYMPLLFKSIKEPGDVKVAALADGTATFTADKEIKAKSGNVYQYANVHIQKHNSDINGSIGNVVDTYVKEMESVVNAVKHEYNGKNYAISYEIRPDLEYTVLNVIYPVTDNVSAFFALKLNATPDSITDELLDKICKDTEVKKI